MTTAALHSSRPRESVPEGRNRCLQRKRTGIKNEKLIFAGVDQRKFVQFEHMDQGYRLQETRLFFQKLFLSFILVQSMRKRTRLLQYGVVGNAGIETYG